MPEILNAKLNTLASEIIPSVNLSQGIDISTSPTSSRISFPSQEYTPAFQILETIDFGKFLRSSNDIFVSELKNVSSDSTGDCWITANVFGKWNSHAGSHADQPKHWLSNPPFKEFDNRQYLGTSTILDVSDLLLNSSIITVAVIKEIAFSEKLDLNFVRRLFFRTYKKVPEDWDSSFAFFDSEVGKFLGQLPNLVLVGIDTPSVDHPNASPIISHSHGELWKGRVAILEGLNFDSVVRRARVDGVVSVEWNPMQIFEDAKGALVRFFAKSYL